MCALPSLKPLSAIIVDDEPVAIERLRTALQAHPQVNVIGTATDGMAAVKLINTECPDLVFMDIQMPGLNGFGVVGQLTHEPLIIFVTAYDAYAVAAFEQNSLDYLLKPVAPERLAITVRRALDRKNEQSLSFAKLKEMVTSEEKKEYISTIPVKLGHKIQLIPVNEICYFEAKDKYVYLHTFEDESLIERSLSYLEERLPPDFIRVHRSYLINKHKIKEMQKYFKGGFVFILDDQACTRIKSATAFNKEIKEKLLLL
jgi:DNA-binding LytR/AlgR family response regulator